MKIQEYGCETAPQSVEFTEEALELIEKLGAAGQGTFYKHDRAVCPYRKMSKIEFAVYRTCLPVREPIDKFSAGPIPLRVLQVGAHATSLLDGTLVIWHAGVGKDDPLLTLRQGSEWNGEYYLLARWAEELEEFSVLLDRAIDELTVRTKSELSRIQSEIDGWTKNTRDLIASRLRDGKIDMPATHWY